MGWIPTCMKTSVSVYSIRIITVLGGMRTDPPRRSITTLIKTPPGREQTINAQYITGPNMVLLDGVPSLTTVALFIRPASSKICTKHTV